MIQVFSTDYANGISAIAASGTLRFALVTLRFLKREYVIKYRPYVALSLIVEPKVDSKGFIVSLAPKNVGPHSCEFMLKDIRLQIGDDKFEVPDFTDWQLLAPNNAVDPMRTPVGHINDQRIRKIREARYKLNRIEVSVSLLARSVEQRFEQVKLYIYEINVESETPVAISRPEWNKKS